MTSEVVNGLFALGGAVLGALVTGYISWKQAKKYAKRNELSVITSRASNLLKIDSTISEVVKISIGEDVIPSVFTFDILLINSGSETLYDLEVITQIDNSLKIIACDISLSNFELVDGKYLARKESDTNVIVEADYLNPGDELMAKVLVTGDPGFIKSSFRQAGVKLILRDNFDPTTPDVFTRALFESVRKNFLLHTYMKMSIPFYRRFVEYEEKIDRDRR